MHTPGEENMELLKEYIGRRKGTPGRKVSILGPLDPPGTLGPGRREIQISGNNPLGHQTHYSYISAML